jgi:hypothetical protein
MLKNTSTSDVDLFGNPVPPPPPPTKPSPATNDMDLIERVLQVACQDGYALVGSGERVYRVGSSDRTGTTEITAATREEADAVHQLIDNKDLVAGGQHRYRFRNHRESDGRAVLVPRATRAKASRWAALTRPSTWSATRPATGSPGGAVTVFVDIVAPGSALINVRGLGHSGRAGREGRGLYVEDTDAEVRIGTARSYEHAGRLFARYHGLTDVVIEIDKEWTRKDG